MWRQSEKAKEILRIMTEKIETSKVISDDFRKRWRKLIDEYPLTLTDILTGVLEEREK